MSVIWKYPIPVGMAPIFVLMPEGAEVVHVATQIHVATQSNGRDQTLCAWALVDPSAPEEQAVFFTVATGQEFGEEWEHVGTGLFHNGLYVWHLLRRRTPTS